MHRIACVGLLLLAGCVEVDSRYPTPPARFAAAPVGPKPSTSCFESTQPFDQEFGCLGWRGGIAFDVVHRNAMSPTFRLVGAAYSIDGVMALDTNDPTLVGRDTLTVATAELTPGRHELSAELVFTGEGQGVFSYLRGYRFRAQGQHVFEVKRGKPISIVVVAHEEGGPTTPIQKRPRVRFVETPQ
jgi:hypothetical protein